VFKEKLKAGWYWFALWGCRFFCILFFRVRACGTENVPEKGPFILVSNHQSFLDPIFCTVALKRQLCYVARDSLFANRFFGWVISSVNTIPVKRGKTDLSAIKRIIRLLKEGKGVCLFPEGTRTSDGKIASLKPGFSLFCKRTEASIVPVVIDGAFECWPRNKKVFSSGSISVCYGKAIKYEQVKNISDERLAELLTDTLRQMQNDCLLKQGKKIHDY